MEPRLIKNFSHSDRRGEFKRIFDVQEFGPLDLKIQQVNISVNPKPFTLRGMHHQVSGPAEHKFITVILGSIFLVVSNAHLVSKRSEVENKYFELSCERNETLFVPSGMATGWLSRTENVQISYLMTSRFQDCEYSGFRFDDAFAGISWPEVPRVVSENDLNWPFLK